MKELDKKLKSWQVLCLSLSGIIFTIFIIFFLFNFNIAFSNSYDKEIDLKKVQVVAIKATNSSKSRIAVYKDKRKIFTAPCISDDNLCNLVGFTVKISAERVKGIQQSESTFFISEIHFTDGNVYKNLEVNQAKNLIKMEKEKIINSFIIFIAVSFIFFVLGFILFLFRKKLCLSKV